MFGFGTILNVAIGKKYAVSEASQTQFALRSRQRAMEATLDENIAPISVKQKKVTLEVTQDEIYATATQKALPADAAAVCLLMNQSALEENHLKPLAEIVSVGISAGDPLGEGLLGTAAAEKALKKAGKTIDEMDLIELSEITPAQALAAALSLGISEVDMEQKLNIYGGTLATGNPWGATGIILLNRLICALREQKKDWGLVLCGATGGQAIAAVVRVV